MWLGTLLGPEWRLMGLPLNFFPLLLLTGEGGTTIKSSSSSIITATRKWVTTSKFSHSSINNEEGGTATKPSFFFQWPSGKHIRWSTIFTIICNLKDARRHPSLLFWWRKINHEKASCPLPLPFLDGKSRTIFTASSYFSTIRMAKNHWPYLVCSFSLHLLLLE